MDTVRIKIIGFDFPARADATILEASREAYGAKQWDIEIPTLCQLPGIREEDSSGVCVVEVVGTSGLVNASTTMVSEGMEVLTRSEAVMSAQSAIVRGILDVHDQDCRNCTRTNNCELQDLVYRQTIVTDSATNKHHLDPIDESSIVIRNPNKCVRCGRCIIACRQIQGVKAIEMQGEGLDGKVVPAHGAANLSGTKCVNCGQCIIVCPVGALSERDDTQAVFDALADPNKYVVVQAAPSVRAGIGEAFGFPIGSETEGRLAAVLRALGFDRVYDTVFGADLTIMEEANEFIGRIQNGGALPQFTSCCPAWVKFCEQEYPGILANISSCKAPHTMLGAITKDRLSRTEAVALEDIVMVSIMPCTAKKFEITRDDECGAGVPDVDFALTVRELSRMIEQRNIQFSAFGPESFDAPFGTGTGAGTIFGATGGVMEAALRTVADTLTGQDLADIEYRDVRGTEGIKEAQLEIDGHQVRVAAASGLSNARKLAQQVADGTSPYDFIEIMACPGGCVNGGGQPQQKASVRASADLRERRAKALYSIDERDTLRKSHDNPFIGELYKTTLGQPGSARAHELLHTTYVERV